MFIGKDNGTAILVFANSSKAELENKPMVHGVELFHALTRRTIRVVSQSGLPFYLYTEKEQEGNTFSERFTNALKAVFEKGYSRVISVGNDSPQLSIEDLTAAHQQLLLKQNVLGPSADGGIYLMGIHRADFSQNQLQSLPWNTSNLCAALVHLLSNAKKVIKLRTLFDIDTFEDLKRFTCRFRAIGKRLLSIVLNIISSKKVADFYPVSSYTLLLATYYFNKGSPIC